VRRMRWLALAVMVLGSCSGPALRSRLADVNGVIAKARQNGAYVCAPVDLAKAEAHAEFAGHELDDGDSFRAEEELAVAGEHAYAALRKSPPEHCALPGDKDGDGIKDTVDKCPEDPEDKDGFEDADGCPEPDNDKDGILDKADKCPNDPEDKDGFQDEDGCPDPDNDGDGLADGVDKCVNEPEDADGFEDDDGCPDPDNDGDGVLDGVDACPLEYGKTPDGCPQKYQLIVVTKDKIELKQTVYFAFNKWNIKPVSFPLLDEVAQAMNDNPKIKVRIEGHTDSVGNDKRNMTLSQKRAEAVRTYLIKKGISPDRMEAKGFGETVPIADNRTKEGRDQNRRVEFFITSQ
jgi:OOP family OmpA-OmpF porin